jgi:hypothetical protein
MLQLQRKMRYVTSPGEWHDGDADMLSPMFIAGVTEGVCRGTDLRLL